MSFWLMYEEKWLSLSSYRRYGQGCVSMLTGDIRHCMRDDCFFCSCIITGQNMTDGRAVHGFLFHYNYCRCAEGTIIFLVKEKVSRDCVKSYGSDNYCRSKIVVYLLSNLIQILFLFSVHAI